MNNWKAFDQQTNSPVARPNPNLKVAFVTSLLSNRGGGVKTVVEELSRELGASGVDSHVFGLTDRDWYQRDRSAWAGGPVSAFDVRGPKAFGYAPGMLRALINWQPDIVHTHGLWMYPSKCSLDWSEATGRPHVVSPHGMLSGWALAKSRKKKALANALFEHRHLNQAARVIALCDSENSDIRCASVKSPIDVVANGVNFETTVGPETPPWHGKTAPGDRVMLFLGRLCPQKNLLAFLKSWQKAAQSDAGTNWCLAFAGWGKSDYEAELKNLAASLGLGHRVIFLGPLYGTQKRAALGSADAFVLPSVSEGLPMSILEAWSFCLPVLMTQACNLPEGFEHNAAVKLSHDPDCASADITRFLTLSDTALASIGQNGLKLVNEKFRWSSAARQLTGIYESCLSQQQFQRSA